MGMHGNKQLTSRWGGQPTSQSLDVDIQAVQVDQLPRTQDIILKLHLEILKEDVRLRQAILNNQVYRTAHRGL